jgi:hypothetical protein
MASVIGQFSELEPDLKRVNENIDLLRQSVNNLENFYQIGDVQKSLKSLYERLDRVTNVVNRLSNGSNTTIDHKLEHQLRRIDTELSECQNRMSALESVCNSIILSMDQSNEELNVEERKELEFMKQLFVGQYTKTAAEIGDMRTRLDTLLKNYCPDMLCRSSSQLNDDSYSDSSLSTNEMKVRRRRNSSPLDADAATSQIPNGQTNATVQRPNGLASRTISTARQNSTLRTVLSCAILMGIGLLLLYASADEEIFSRSGHWRFKFGPQLRYVRGKQKS